MSDRKDEKTKKLEERIEAKLLEYESFFASPAVKAINFDEKIDEVDSLIEHVNQRITYAESRITRTVTFSITLIGIGMALFAVIIKLQGFSFYLGLITTILFILTGGLTSVVHIYQIYPKYPFRALGNDWKWFYPKIVSEKYKASPLVKESKNKYFEKRLLHVEDLNKYANKIINENKLDRLKVDIQQLYLLHVNEKYKNNFLVSLRKILTWGLSFTVISLVSLFIVVAAEQIRSVKQSAAISKTEQKMFSSDEERFRRNRGGAESHSWHYRHRIDDRQKVQNPSMPPSGRQSRHHR